VEQNLSVAFATKTLAGCAELSAQFSEIINLSVEDDRISGTGMDHRLMAKRREVYDRKPPMSEAQR
jgi:hypothetical protein